MGEGLLMVVCNIVGLLKGDAWEPSLLLCACALTALGWSLNRFVPKGDMSTDRRLPYLLVTLLWLVVALFGTIPFLTTGCIRSLPDALFESMSGFTSTGATVVNDVEQLPATILLWRSATQWVGGFGIILIVLAVVPTLGINKYSLYTAEASGADAAKSTNTTRDAVRHTLSVYLLLTFFFITALRLSGLHWWEAINLTFTNISSGGFSTHNDGLSSLPHASQWLLGAAMLLSGINFTLMYDIGRLRFRNIKNKLEQLRYYIAMSACCILLTVITLHFHDGETWPTALRLGTLQGISFISTTGSLLTDTEQWWMPLLIVLMTLTLCGGMAGSTAGGLKTMRIVILLRNVRNLLRGRLHPHAVSPIRLNGHPVAPHLITNVMVIFFVYAFVMVAAACLLLLMGVPAKETIGATIGCLTGYGPGLGSCGGLGNYASMCGGAKLLLAFVMLMGRLECLTILLLFIPRFWTRR